LSEEKNEIEQKMSESQLNRRKLLRTVGKISAAAIIGTGGLSATNEVAQADSSDDKNIILPLKLDNARSFKTFMSALEDSKLRAGLRSHSASLPAGARELVAMLDDQEFLKMGVVCVEKFDLMIHGKTTVEEVQRVGQDLYRYINTKYPEGFKTLCQYGQEIFPEYRRQATVLQQAVEKASKGEAASLNFPWLGANIAIAANAGGIVNAGAVVNAVVYANAAVATLAVVVLAVVPPAVS
jgi:hypothetical protein